jgi:hypothetical protein
MSLTSKENKEETISPKILKLMGVIKLPNNFDYKKVCWYQILEQ